MKSVAALSIVSLLAGFGPTAFAQVIGIIHEPVGDEEILSFIDDTSGDLSLQQSAANCCWVSSGASAIDAAGGRVFYLGAEFSDSSSQRRVFTVDASNGNVLSKPLLDGGSTDYSYNFLEYDASSGVLHAVAYNLALASSSGGTIKQEELLVINPDTGAISTVGSGIADCCWVSSGVSAIDGPGGRIFFLGAKFSDSSSQRRIFSVSTTTGAVLSSPLMDGGSTDHSYSFLGWHKDESALYAVPRIVATDSRQLATIDTSTGSLSFLGSPIASCCWTSDGAGALDTANDVFYFLGSLKTESSSQRRLFSLDTTNGAVIANPLVDSGSTTYSQNFLEFRTPVIFADDFESTDLTGWSSSAP